MCIGLGLLAHMGMRKLRHCWSTLTKPKRGGWIRYGGERRHLMGPGQKWAHHAHDGRHAARTQASQTQSPGVEVYSTVNSGIPFRGEENATLDFWRRAA